jgi:hypothetical protein
VTTLASILAAARTVDGRHNERYGSMLYHQLKSAARMQCNSFVDTKVKEKGVCMDDSVPIDRRSGGGPRRSFGSTGSVASCGWYIDSVPIDDEAIAARNAARSGPPDPKHRHDGGIWIRIRKTSL